MTVSLRASNDTTALVAGFQALIEENTICGVCCEKYDDEKRRAVAPPCFHTYCLECLNQVRQCPRCNAAISKEQLKINFDLVALQAALVDFAVKAVASCALSPSQAYQTKLMRCFQAIVTTCQEYTLNCECQCRLFSKDYEPELFADLQAKLKQNDFSLIPTDSGVIIDWEHASHSEAGKLRAHINEKIAAEVEKQIICAENISTAPETMGIYSCSIPVLSKLVVDKLQAEGFTTDLHRLDWSQASLGRAYRIRIKQDERVNAYVEARVNEYCTICSQGIWGYAKKFTVGNTALLPLVVKRLKDVVRCEVTIVENDFEGNIPEREIELSWGNASEGTLAYECKKAVDELVRATVDEFFKVCSQRIIGYTKKFSIRHTPLLPLVVKRLRDVVGFEVNVSDWEIEVSWENAAENTPAHECKAASDNQINHSLNFCLKNLKKVSNMGLYKISYQLPKNTESVHALTDKLVQEGFSVEHEREKIEISFLNGETGVAKIYRQTAETIREKKYALVMKAVKDENERGKCYAYYDFAFEGHPLIRETKEMFEQKGFSVLLEIRRLLIGWKNAIQGSEAHIMYTTCLEKRVAKEYSNLVSKARNTWVDGYPVYSFSNIENDFSDAQDLLQQRLIDEGFSIDNSLKVFSWDGAEKGEALQVRREMLGKLSVQANTIITQWLPNMEIEAKKGMYVYRVKNVLYKELWEKLLAEFNERGFVITQTEKKEIVIEWKNATKNRAKDLREAVDKYNLETNIRLGEHCVRSSKEECLKKAREGRYFCELISNHSAWIKNYMSESMAAQGFEVSNTDRGILVKWTEAVADEALELKQTAYVKLENIKMAHANILQQARRAARKKQYEISQPGEVHNESYKELLILGFDVRMDFKSIFYNWRNATHGVALELKEIADKAIECAVM